MEDAYRCGIWPKPFACGEALEGDSAYLAAGRQTGDQSLPSLFGDLNRDHGSQDRAAPRGIRGDGGALIGAGFCQIPLRINGATKHGEGAKAPKLLTVAYLPGPPRPDRPNRSTGRAALGGGSNSCSLDRRILTPRLIRSMPDRVRLPSISAIVARSVPGNVIGCKNTLPWRLKSDLQRFRSLTQGHAVIMGRTTFASIGRPLPNRANIVLSTSPKAPEGDKSTQLYWTEGPDSALFIADLVSVARNVEEILIIGGGTIYDLFDPLINKFYLTEVSEEFEGDAFFEKQFNTRDWEYLSKEAHPKNSPGDEHSYRFSILERRQRQYRYQFLASFYTDRSSKTEGLKATLGVSQEKIASYAQAHLEL